jgi:predicted amidohydrolase YtcJ
MVACAKTEPADVVFTNGNIYTLAGEPAANVEGEAKATAIAVRGGRIVAIGTDAAVQRYRGGNTQAHDLGGATVFPGWVDCHVHLQRPRSQAARRRPGRDGELRRGDRACAARAATLPPGTWVRGRGWDQNDWPEKDFPDHAALSQAVPEHPVYLRRIDGHALLVNAAALAIAVIDARTADPPGGRIERRADGTPSGVLVDGAVQLVTRFLPPPDEAERRSSLRTALEHCAAQGLTGVHDAGASVAEIDDDRALLAAGELRLRVYEMWAGRSDADSADVRRRWRPAAALRCDGAFGAALRQTNG